MLFALLSCFSPAKVSFATGASAGGLVAGLFAAGLSPAHMGETVVKFRRSDFWDPIGFGGLLRGKKFEVRETRVDISVDQCVIQTASGACSEGSTRGRAQSTFVPHYRLTDRLGLQRVRARVLYLLSCGHSRRRFFLAFFFILSLLVSAFSHLGFESARSGVPCSSKNKLQSVLACEGFPVLLQRVSCTPPILLRP